MSLFEPSFSLAPYTYQGERLREIAFPLGGIGTGCVSLDGRGGLRDWEIFNRPNKGSFLETTFAALWFKEIDSAPRALVVRGPRVRDWMGEGRGTYDYGHGQFFKQMDGLPGFDSVEFAGSFPFARLKFAKDNLPVEVELCGFNPFIPLDVRSSSFPLACLVYRVKNICSRPLDLSLAFTMTNPVTEGIADKTGSEDKAWNEFFATETCKGISFTNERFAEGDVHSGSAALTSHWSEVSVRSHWQSEGWFDGIQSFWNSFRETGRVDAPAPKAPGPRVAGTIAALSTLQPGENVEIPFAISWVFPVATKYWGGEDQPAAKPWKPYYATTWPTASAAAEEFWSRFEELKNRTLAFEEALFTSTLPSAILESVSATASILHSPTVLRLEDDTFWAWEGCSPTEGCCSGTCSHVWNYALTHAFLFPEIQHSMRRTEYRNNFKCGPMGLKGALDFRVMLPLGSETTLWHAASDGQLGGVIQLYRDWRLSGDNRLLEELWPSAKRALEFAWVQWDRDRDGLVDGDMHNTYDINFQGPNPLTQFFYLGALKAAQKMAEHLGDLESAKLYESLFMAGQQKTKETLWNGEFFQQAMDCEAADAPKYQHGKGCLTDQVFGQLSAKLAGLGDLVDEELMLTTLRSIYHSNFRDLLGDHENLQRVYAASDEPGLLLCSWPNGGRPDFPFVYSDEVWTGIEYQFATHLLLEGMSDETLSIVEGIRKRYDGVRRNPYNEFECGSHYARALASYGLILAGSGFHYDAIEQTIGIEPRFGDGKDFQCFFCTPHGWGTAKTLSGKAQFELVEGALFRVQE